MRRRRAVINPVQYDEATGEWYPLLPLAEIRTVMAALGVTADEMRAGEARAGTGAGTGTGTPPRGRHRPGRDDLAAADKRRLVSELLAAIYLMTEVGCWWGEEGGSARSSSLTSPAERAGAGGGGGAGRSRPTP